MTDQVTLFIDGKSVSVPKGTLIIRAAEQLGIEIPRFCDHPALDPVGACRQCLVALEPDTRVFGDPFFSAIVRGVSQELTGAGLQLVVARNVRAVRAV